MEARRARVLLVCGLVPLLAYLLVGDHPWELPGGPGFVAERGESLFLTAKIAIWWTSAVNAVLLGALLATVTLWTRAPERTPAAHPVPSLRGFGVLLLLAAVLTCAVRANLFAGGLFWDEVWTARRAVLGGYEPDPETGTLVFEEVPWRKTLWTYHKPTNHILQSVAARISNDAWQTLTGRGPEAFDERVLRLPSLLACAAAVILLGLAVRDWGFPRAALLAALLLALHPWHVRYGAALRGYGFVAVGAAASAFTLTRVLASGAWRWLALYAASQVFLIWSHPFGFYLTLAMGGSTLAVLVPGRRVGLAARFFVANLLAGMFLLQVMGPAIAQVPLWEHVHDIQQGSKVRPNVLRELWAQAAVGMPQRLADSARDVAHPSVEVAHPSVEVAHPSVEVAHPSVGEGPVVRRIAVWVVLPALFALGALAALRRVGPHRVAVLGLALGVPVAVLGARIQGHSFYDRFAIWFVIATSAFFALGWGALAGVAARGRRRTEDALLVLGGLLFLALVAPQLGILLERPQAGMKQAVAWLGAAPGSDRAVKAGLGLGGDNAKVYDPELRYFEEPAALRALIAEATASGAPLYVYYGYEAHNRSRWGETFVLLDDAAHFEETAVFPGVEPEFGYRVLRYVGPGS